MEEQLSTFKAKMRQHNWKQQIGIDWVKELGKQFTPAQWDRFEAKMLLIGKFLMTSSETVPMSMATIMLNSLQYVIKNQSRESVREIMKLK